MVAKDFYHFDKRYLSSWSFLFDLFHSFKGPLIRLIHGFQRTVFPEKLDRSLQFWIVSNKGGTSGCPETKTKTQVSQALIDKPLDTRSLAEFLRSKT